jgi:hypothetical protein
MFFKTFKVASITGICLLATIGLFSGNVLAFADNSELTKSQIADLTSLGSQVQSSDKNVKEKVKGKISEKIKKTDQKKLEKVKTEADYKSLTRDEKESYIASQIVVEEKTEVVDIITNQGQRGVKIQDRNSQCWTRMPTRSGYNSLGQAMWKFGFAIRGCAEWNYMTYGEIVGNISEYLPLSGWKYYGLTSNWGSCGDKRIDCVFYRKGYFKLCYWSACPQEVRPWIEYHLLPLNATDWYYSGT